MALSGTFGYELDLLDLSEEDKILIPQYVQLHADIESIVRYCLSSCFFAFNPQLTHLFE